MIKQIAGIKSCVTVCLLPSLRGGPWIYWDGLEASVAKAKEAGFDAVELFTGPVRDVDANQVARVLEINQIELAAVGTGAGKMLYNLYLTSPDANVRREAVEFIKQVIAFAGRFDATAIIGSMQGMRHKEITVEQTHSWLIEGLTELADYADKLNSCILFEPLNRYETNLINTIAQSAAVLDKIGSTSIKLLADLFHMNIEEESIPQTLRNFGNQIGHVHFADSNRRPVGMGHLFLNEIAVALKEINYNGYLSAEALSYPDAKTAAEQTMKAFRCFFDRKC
jgi:sugar phosphate isomerase/epimerase